MRLFFLFLSLLFFFSTGPLSLSPIEAFHGMKKAFSLVLSFYWFQLQICQGFGRGKINLEDLLEIIQILGKFVGGKKFAKEIDEGEKGEEDKKNINY